MIAMLKCVLTLGYLGVVSSAWGQGRSYQPTRHRQHIADAGIARQGLKYWLAADRQRMPPLL
jgi:hypothetical protein